MTSIIISPAKYIQGSNELNNIASYISKIGQNPLILISVSGIQRVGQKIENSFSNSNVEFIFETFNGECSKNEIDRLTAIFIKNNCDTVIGIGGGKILDTAKALAYFTKSPVMIVPTIASTDAPCTALSVLYNDDGTFSKYLFLPKNPDIVLMDTNIIASAPSRLLVAGMGDALATYFEARTCAQNPNSITLAGGSLTLASMGLAKLCYDTLLSDGLKAKTAVDIGVCTKAVENIIEANTYLSGIGAESGGLAGAHSIHNGFTVLESCHNHYHGEKVAFGTLVQLILENAPIKEIEEVIFFCREIGLPITLEEIGLVFYTDEDIMAVAKASVAIGETIHNTSFKVTKEMVYAAILTADALGKSYI